MNNTPLEHPPTREDLDLSIDALRARRDAFRFDALTCPSPASGATDHARADGLHRVLSFLMSLRDGV